MVVPSRYPGIPRLLRYPPLDTRLCGYDVEGERGGVLTQKGEGRFLAMLGMALLGSACFPQTFFQQSECSIHKCPHVGFTVRFASF